MSVLTFRADKIVPIGLALLPARQPGPLGQASWMTQSAERVVSLILKEIQKLGLVWENLVSLAKM